MKKSEEQMKKQRIRALARYHEDKIYRDKQKVRHKEYMRSNEEQKEKSRNRSKIWYHNNVDKSRTYHKTYKQKYPMKARERQLKYAYNITLEQYNEMLKSQDYRCAICGTDQPGGHKNKSFHVDHNHITGKVRGLLCNTCNIALGMLKIDEHGDTNLINALSYVKENEVRQQNDLRSEAQQ